MDNPVKEADELVQQHRTAIGLLWRFLVCLFFADPLIVYAFGYIERVLGVPPLLNKLLELGNWGEAAAFGVIIVFTLVLAQAWRDWSIRRRVMNARKILGKGES